MGKSFWVKAGFLIFSVVLALVVAEVGLRIFTPEPVNLAKLKSSSLFLFENKPNAVFGRNSGEYNVDITINSSGFRDTEFSEDKPSGVFRMAVIGDSQTEASQVKLEDTWEKVMVRRLGEVTGKKIETYSFGVSGYGTDQEWLTLREKVWMFKPNLVVLAFSPNDVGDVYKNGLVKLNGNGEIEVTTEAQRAGGNFLGKAARETYLYHLFVQALSGSDFGKRVVNKVRVKILGFPKDDKFFLSDAQLVQGPFEVIASQKNPPKEVLNTWQVVKTLILDMKKQADGHGSGFMITICIPRAQVDIGDWDKLVEQYKIDAGNSSPHEINDVLVQFAQENEIPIYDMREDANAWKQENGILHFPLDGHFNVNGNKFMGTKMADFVADKKLLP